MSSAFKIGIIGNGKAGNFLAKHFSVYNLEVYHFSRKPKNGQIDLINYSSSYDLDLLFIAVSDTQIQSVCEVIDSSPTVIVHLSGTTPISQIHTKHPNRGVFWPLMSLSPHTLSNIDEIPFCLETNNDDSKKLVEKFCDFLKLKRQWTDYPQRLKLHLAAVMSQNFSNHLFHLTHDILQKENLDLELFKPILVETVNRLGKTDPKEFQTGPALRNDQLTIKRHLELLEGSSNDIYKIISKSIQEAHERKL